MKHRMAAAVLAMLGLFLAVYLSLWKMGLVGVLSCGNGSCDVVQTSEYAYLAGIPVAYFGVAGYLVLLIISLIGLQPPLQDRRAPTVALALVSGGGVLFTIYLTYLEAFVIDAWCRWCLVSAGIIVAIFVVAITGLSPSHRTTSSPN